MTERDGADDGVIEVELTGDGPLSPLDPDGAGSDRVPVNWRRSIGIALVAGSLLGIVGGLVLRSLENDEPESPAGTSVPSTELSTLITTPPTLAPLDTLPPPDFAQPVDDGPQPTTSQDRALFDGAIAPPSYPAIDAIPLSEVLTYRIEPAIEALVDDAARRSRTRVELGAEGYVIEVTIERDPVLDRYQLVFEQRGQTQVAIVDTATNTTYVNPGTDNLVTILNDQLLVGSGAADINEYFDRLLLGPLRPDTYSAPGTSGRSMYELDDVGPVRQFATRIEGELVPEWQIYTFAPVPEFRPQDRPPTLDYFAYVDENGDLVQVDGVALIGDVPQLIQHRIERLDDSHRVDLPEPVIPATTPATTTPAADVAPSTTIDSG